MNDAFDPRILWERWMPEIDYLDGRYRLCKPCKEKMALPYKDRCQACYNAYIKEHDGRIQRRRKGTGFSDDCTDCRSNNNVWVVSFDYYTIERGRKGYSISVNEFTSALCESCIERMIGIPVYCSNERVTWGRNIRYIRKAPGREYAHITTTQKAK